MKRLLIKLYGITPNWFRERIGKTAWLRGFRDLLLKHHGTYREVHANITKSYVNNDVNFEFYASVKNVAKAYKKGIENTLLINSFKLFNDYKTHNNDCVIFDVGANFGYLSLVWATSLCKNKGSLYAFEPNQKVYNSFLKSIAKNNLKSIITAEHKAIGSENGIIDLYLNNTTSNLIKDDTSSVEITQIDMVTLDSYCNKNNITNCDLIKIDVDGIELDILKGSIKILSKFRPIFIVETNNDERIIDFFKKHEYSILDMTLETYVSTDKIPLNIFCIPNN